MRINIAEMHFTLGDHTKSKEILEFVVYKTKKAHGELYALAIQHLAKNALISGDWELALKYLKEAINILDARSSKANISQLISALSVYGNINLSQSKYNDALLSFERAYAINLKNYGHNDIFNAIILDNISTTLRSLGRYKIAALKAKLAIEILDKSPNSTIEQRIKAKNTLALALLSLGERSKARDILLDSFNIASKLDSKSITFINAAMNLGDFYTASDEYLLASIKYKEAFDAIDMKKFYGATKVPEILAKYSGSEFLNGHNTEAKWLGYQSLSYSLATMDDPIGLIAPLYWIALSHYKENPNAGILVLKYVVNLLQMSKEDVAKLGVKNFIAYSESYKDWYHLLAKWLTDVGRIDEAKQVLKLYKENEYYQFIKRSVDPMQIKSLLSYTPSETKLFEQFIVSTNKIKLQRKQEFLLQDKSSAGLSKQETAKLAAIKTQIEENKKLLSSAFDKKLEVDSTPQKQANYATEKDVVQLKYSVSEDQLTIFLTGQNINIVKHLALEKHTLHQKIYEFNKVLRNPKSNPKPIANELYKLIFEPIANDIDNVEAKTIILDLEDVLRNIPFGALYNDSGYLINKYQFPIYTSYLGDDKTKDMKSPPWQVSAMGVTQSIRGFSALPGVKYEVDSIVRHGSDGILPGQILLDKDFTSLALQEATKQNYQVLHIASHFVLSPGTEANSFLLMGDGQELTLGDIRTQNFDFSHVDLLTLSACETGMGGGGGVDDDGREIEGFGITAQRQGAKSVLATLWPIADKSTAILMKYFYQLHQDQKLSKAEALREAQVDMLNGTQDHIVAVKKGPTSRHFNVDPKKPYAHPFYWAPFILMGNWN